MSGLATKQQSLKLFEKLKTKPANKVCDAQGPSVLRPPFPDRLPYTALTALDLLRLRPEEPHVDIGPLRHLPVPRLLG